MEYLPNAYCMWHKKRKSIKMKKKILLTYLLILCMTLSCTYMAFAIDRPDNNPIDTSLEDSRDAGTDLYYASKFHNVLPLAFASSDGQSLGALLDENYRTSVTFSAGTRLTVASTVEMDSIFIVWDTLNVPFILEINGQQYTYGQNGFLHEYIKLPVRTVTFDIIIPDSAAGGARPGTVSGGSRISDIYAFDADSPLPSWVQTWAPVTTAADIVVVSAHADDEQIFFGGILPTYQAERDIRVQLVYLTNHWTYSSDSKVREHEKLAGLWTAGIRHYPITGDFGDGYAETLEGAMQITNFDAATLFLAQCFRITHPQVIVTHDVNGEYGHGQHRLASAAVCNAVEAAANPEYDPGSASAYGVWNTPKLYLHLATDNQIKLNFRVPLVSFPGKRAIDVARQAYLCHDSQQYCWFTVDDYGALANNLFGLVRSTVGTDTSADVMENLTPYRVQEEIRRQEEESRLAEESSIQASIEESMLQASIEESIEESKRKESEETSVADNTSSIVESKENITPTVASSEVKPAEMPIVVEKKGSALPSIVIVLIVLAVAGAAAFFVIKQRNTRHSRNKRRRKKRKKKLTNR